MADVEFVSHADDFLRLMEGATEKGATEAGMMIANAAKRLCSPLGPMGNPMRDAAELRNSITYQVENYDGGLVLMVGSNMQIAPYIELGTGKYYDPQPEWLEYNGDDRHSVGGLDEWWYFDELENVFRIGKPIPSQPYLRPAVLDHTEDIRNIIQENLEDA